MTRKTSKSSKKRLVIVESPAKARTLSNILGSEYDVRASVGHVRDLPKSRLGVDVENDFEPRYIVPKDKKEIVKSLTEAAKKAGVVYLATDPDREGEAISWHLQQAMSLDGRPYQRVEFHEITTDAVKSAFEHPREIDKKLVDAYQARRVLDRLVGYKISPILWSKIRGGLSAGRVQSVALRMIVDREREIDAFVPHEYWTIDAKLAKQADADDQAFGARLAGLPGTKKAEIGSSDQAQRTASDLRAATYRVVDVKKKQQTRRPSPPFTTSTLQQEASRRFGYSAKRTMALAQQLYEGLQIPGEGQVGLITYMRTDSLNIAQVAREEARVYIGRTFGHDFVPAQPRFYKTKAKGAQEAHEAIRPTSVMRDPASMRRSLNNDQAKLYTLIWQRLVASQMADAIFDQVSAEIEAAAPGQEKPYLLRASASHMRFPGFRQLYIEGRDGDAADDDAEKTLPELTAGDPLRNISVTPDQHFTEPPPRFTEATLVKALEENGIGRPSTYAATISTVLDRGYVKKDGRALRPEELGLVVSDMMTERFPAIVDVGFTARMEGELDDVANGERSWPPVVRELYDPLEEALAAAAEAPRVEQATEETCEKCGKPMVLRWGRFGQFYACTGYPECKTTKPYGDEAAQPQATDEKCDLCGAEMVVKRGRFGQFLACSRYPECKGSRPILKKVGVVCPKDTGEIVEKRSKRGRTFYGCANYPNCDFTSWTRPLKQPCPACGGLIVTATKGRAKCTACDWTGEPDSAVERELAKASA
ncbi:MAG: type I DNA topoisomerase [Dehalococcoidia bacterium]|nr:type I DNA topoisomerase [Dehalococcoidia bacterium]